MSYRWIPALALIAGGWAAAAPFYEDKEDLLYVLNEAGEKMPVDSPETWSLRRAHLLENMQKVMGPWPGDARRVPLDIQVELEEEFPTHFRRKITFAVEPGDRLPAYLLIPKKINAKAPAMLCLHPTSEHGKAVVLDETHRPNRLYATELAERGYVTLAPDYPGFGEYKDARKWLYANGYASATMKAIFNHSRCVDLLQSLDEVDPERIGAIGHSLGGHNSLYLGVFEPRVKVMVTSCGFNTFRKYYGGNLTGWSHEGYMPRIAERFEKDPSKMPFDFTEVLGALAPRPVFINAPLHDENFEVSGVQDCVRAAAPVYALFGAEDHLVAVYPEAEHDFPNDVREEAYRFLDHHL
jgi:dienelactone hydrolase